MDDFDMVKFLKGFGETKETLTDKYLKGLINKDEYFKRMKKLERKN